MALVPPVALLLLLLASPVSAEPLHPGQLAARLTPSDARGRTLELPVPGRTTLLTFAGPSNGEAVGAISRALRVDHPELEVVALIDLSRYPRLLRGIARRAIVQREASALQETRQAFADAGRTAPSDLAERVFVVPDFEAACFERYGVRNSDARPLMVLVDAEGIVRSVFEARSLEHARAAMERARAQAFALPPVAAAETVAAD